MESYTSKAQDRSKANPMMGHDEKPLAEAGVGNEDSLTNLKVTPEEFEDCGALRVPTEQNTNTA